MSSSIISVANSDRHQQLVINPSAQVKVSGNITIPGDKSISHRALMLGAIAQGETFFLRLLLFAFRCCYVCLKGYR